jgi:cyclopropane-fatty-acyl-phospholipid synthase
VATRENVEPIYNFIDELWRATFGETADFSNALYDGDFSKTLEEAQADKHRYILGSIGFRAGSRVLDIGCGWGAMLNVVKKAGGTAVGLTLSRRQAESCRRAGLDARLVDWRDASVDDLGAFDSIVCLGALEHFCSADEYISGRQDDVYRRFFRMCHEVLVKNGRLYLQTMLWAARTPAYRTVSLRAPLGSAEYIFAVIEQIFPDSCFPQSVEQLRRTAEPYFRLVTHSNGRLDYVETIEVWRRRLRRLTPPKAWIFARLFASALRERDLRVKLELLARPYFSECFRRELMDHERMVFEST